MHPLLAHIERHGPDRCLVLTPRQTAVRALMRELTTGGSPLFGLRIETPATIIDRLILQVPDLRPLLDDSSAEAIIGDIARQLSGKESGPLMQLLTRPSGQRVALATIKELRLNGYSPEHLRKSSSHTLVTLARMMERYDDFCRRHEVMDWPMRQLAVIESLESGEANVENIECLIVSSFSVIPHHYRRLISALAKGRGTVLNIPIDRTREPLFADGIELAGLLGEAEIIDRTSTDSDSPLTVFQGSLFIAERSRVPEAADVVRFHSVPGRFDEVEAAVIEIDRLLSEGVAPSVIGLTTRSLPDYDRFIGTVFDHFSIPYFYRRGIPMLQSPAIRLAMKLTELGEDAVRYDALLGILRSRFMPFRHTNELRDHILNGEVHTETPQGWIRIIERYEEKTEQDVPFLDLLRRCVALHQRDGSRGTSMDFLSELEKIISDYIDGALNKLGDSDDKNIRELAAVYREHLKSFSELLRTLDREISRLREWGIGNIDSLQILRDRISRETIAEPYPPQEAVNVFNFFDMGYQRVDHLFVIGMDEHSVPRSTPTAGLLGEEELALLEKIRSASPGKFGTISDPVSRRRAEERDFVLALSSARQSIDLYSPTLDADGKELIPSPYFSECMWIAGVDEPTAEPGGDMRSLADVQPDEYSIRRQLLRHLYRTDVEVDAAAAQTLLSRMLEEPEDEQFICQIGEILAIEEQRRKSLFREPGSGFDKWTGRFENPELIDEIADRFGEKYGWSYTALQAYARSPFAFFTQDVLRLRELNTPLEEGDPRRLGTLYHKILQSFVRQMSPHYPLSDFDEAKTVMDQCIATEFEEQFGSADPANLGMLGRIRYVQTNAVMRRFLQREMQRSGNRPDPERLEFKFENDDCIVDLNEMSIRLRGAFDRVDAIISEGSADLEIIDYKKRLSWGMRPSEVSLSNGANLQLPIYLLAAAQLFSADLANLRGRLLGLENGEECAFDPMKKARRSREGVPNYPQFMGLEAGAERTLHDLLKAYIQGARRGDFRADGVLDDRINLVGRWLELPPELVD